MRRGFTKKRCPKCDGNIFIEDGSYAALEGDYHSGYEWCLQCGYQRNLQTSTVLMEESKTVPATEESVSV